MVTAAPTKLDPTKNVTSAIISHIGLALHKPDTDWKFIDNLLILMAELVRINSKHGKFQAARQITEFGELIHRIRKLQDRSKLVILFDSLKDQIEKKQQMNKEISQAEKEESLENVLKSQSENGQPS